MGLPHLEETIWFLCSQVQELAKPNGSPLIIDDFEHTKGKKLSATLRSTIPPARLMSQLQVIEQYPEVKKLPHNFSDTKQKQEPPFKEEQEQQSHKPHEKEEQGNSTYTFSEEDKVHLMDFVRELLRRVLSEQRWKISGGKTLTGILRPFQAKLLEDLCNGDQKLLGNFKAQFWAELRKSLKLTLSFEFIKKIAFYEKPESDKFREDLASSLRAFIKSRHPEIRLSKDSTVTRQIFDVSKAKSLSDVKEILEEGILDFGRKVGESTEIWYHEELDKVLNKARKA